MTKKTIPASDETWDDRTLGADENFAVIADQSIEGSIDELSGTQLISIRLQKSLIEDFKMIASLNSNIGYQTLMKQILQRFADSEKKRILRELVAEKLEEQQREREESETSKPRERTRKAA